MKTYYTEEANKVIEEFKDNTNVLEILEFCEHDGYDKYGPKSNLWYLFIFKKVDNEIFITNFYREEWFTSQDDLYEFENTKNIKDLSIQEISFFYTNRFQYHIDNVDLRKIFNNLFISNDLIKNI